MLQTELITNPNSKKNRSISQFLNLKSVILFFLSFQTPQPYRQNSLGRPVGSEENAVIEIHQEKNKTATFDELKKILFFTPYFHMNDWQFGFGHEPFVKYACPVSNCYTTNNHSLLGKK